MFANQIGKTMEVYGEVMLVKSLMADQHIEHLQKTFTILREYNMKLNRTNCLFGVRFGQFLGFMVTKCGIEANPSQLE